MEKDIFDKIMSLPGLRRFYGLYAKYKEVLLYILFGGVSTVVSIGSFVLCETALGMDVLVANVVSWISAVRNGIRNAPPSVRSADHR